jgi:hypothetical protein
MSTSWTWLTAIFLCTTIGVGGLSFYYYNQLDEVTRNYETLLIEIEELTILVDIRLDYGNETIIWFNDTRLPVGASLLNATEKIAKIEFSKTDFGVFILSINSVSGDEGKFWLWDYFDSDMGEWVYGPVGSDKWILHDGDQVSWKYSSF